MELRPWVISVFSTSYDLEEYRKSIIAELESKGVTVSAFEYPEFPAESDMHSHDSCLVALQRADIAILIINKRSGGLYYNAKDKKTYQSITAKECCEAIEAGIPIFTFVKKDAWDERHAYKKQLNHFMGKNHVSKKTSAYKLKKIKNDFDRNEYVCSYVDEVSTIDFIENMQQAYTNYGVSNWIDQFSTVGDLIERVTGKLKGYSRKLIEQIVESQCSSLKNKHTSTAFGMTLGDVFKSDYYIEPPHEVESGTLEIDESTLGENIHNAICSDKSVLIYGEAGYGKTTILAKCFIDHVEKYLLKPTYDIPIFLSLRNKGNDYHFNIEQFFNEELATTENTHLRHLPYPYLDLSQIRTRFYCDGFDEISEKLDMDDLDRIRDSDIFSRPLLLTCRQQFANRYLCDPSFSDKFGIRVRIKNWNPDIAKLYIEKYCTNRKIDIITKKSIYDSMDNNPDLQYVLDSPLLITMFLWYIGQQKRTISSISSAELFDNWINELATRERTKIAQRIVKKENIIDIWAFTAWEVYCHKIQGNSQHLRFDDLIALLEDKFPNYKSNINPSWFSTLFDCTKDCIIGTFHEQFMEYLVAKVLVSSCIKKEEPYPDFLKMVMRPEINRYFRGIWNQCNNQDKETVFSAIYDLYIHNLGDSSQEAIFSRVHAIYHISRLESVKRAEYIGRAFNVEQHISVLLSLYFGAIKMGMLDKEEEFYKLLSSNTNYNEANRGYHLAYYSDSIAGDELPFRDDLFCRWTGTLQAFVRHFKSKDIGHYYLRRIDLITMRQLLEARKSVEPLTDEFIAFLKEKIENPPYANTEAQCEFNVKVNDEFTKFVKSYSAISKSQ